MGIFNFLKFKNKEEEQKEIKLAPHDDSLTDEEYLDKEDDIELSGAMFDEVPEEERIAPLAKTDEEYEDEEDEQDDDNDEQFMGKDLEAERGASKKEFIKKGEAQVLSNQILQKEKKSKTNKVGKKGHRAEKGDDWDGKTSERNLHRETGGTEIDYEALMLKNERDPGHDEMLAELVEKDEKQVESIESKQKKTNEYVNYKRYRHRQNVKKAVKSAGSHIDKYERKAIKKAKSQRILDMD